jgi:hypothetical protein
VTQRGEGTEVFSLMLEVVTTMANDRLRRKAAVHAQQHLVVDKHELEIESVGLISKHVKRYQ